MAAGTRPTPMKGCVDMAGYTMWHLATNSMRSDMLHDARNTEVGLENLAKTVTFGETMLFLQLRDAKRLNEERLPTSKFRMIWRLGWHEVNQVLCYAQKSEGDTDRYDCVICGQSYTKDEMDIDHSIPRADIVVDNIINYALTCIPCNRLKGEDYTNIGTRKILIQRGDNVDVVAAEDALLRVHRIQMLIWHYEYVANEHIEPFCEALHETFLGWVERFNELNGRLINALNVAIDVKSAEEDAISDKSKDKSKPNAGTVLP